MKKYVNGQYIVMTEKEVQAIQEDTKKADAQENYRPCSVEDAIRFLLRKQLNSIDVEDQTAVRMAEFYPRWQELLGKTNVQSGFKFTYNGVLYKTISDCHTFAPEWVPGAGTESLYTRIDIVHIGDRYDPILYKRNMELKMGFYYQQDGMLYRCIRDSLQPVYVDLKELLGIYTEAV